MHNDRIEQSAYKIEIFEKAINTLEKALAKPISIDRMEIDSCILRFAFTFEFAWKTLKVVLSEKYKIEAKSPKAVLQESFQQGLIDNEELWILMLDDRNEVSHTYDETVGDHVYEHLKNSYFSLLKKTMLMLKEQYGSKVSSEKKK